MYSKELEELIEVALADGTLTDKKKSVLLKRAQSEGIDLDEFEMVLENRLSKQKKSNMVPETSLQATEKLGNIKKCPNCGAVVEAGSIRCQECNYTFVNVKANNSVQRFSEILREIERNYQEKDKGVNSLLKGVGRSTGLYKDTKDSEIATAIETFPIPTTKEDLLEFICFLKPKAEKKNFKLSKFVVNTVIMGNEMDDTLITDAYKVKYEECLTKAKLFLEEDPQFIRLLQQNGIELKDKKPKKFGLF